MKERLLIRNPADGCVVPKVQHQEMKTLQPEDLKACLDAAERRNALAMFDLELVSGIRKGELVALRWADLDVEQRTISVSKQATKDADNNLIVARPKTENSVRQISIPQEAVELLIQEHAKHPNNPPGSSPPPALEPCTTRIRWLPSTNASSRTPGWSTFGSMTCATPSRLMP